MKAVILQNSTKTPSKSLSELNPSLPSTTRILTPPPELQQQVIVVVFLISPSFL